MFKRLVLLLPMFFICAKAALACIPEPTYLEIEHGKKIFLGHDTLIVTGSGCGGNGDIAVDIRSNERQPVMAPIQTFRYTFKQQQPDNKKMYKWCTKDNCTGKDDIKDNEGKTIGTYAMDGARLTITNTKGQGLVLNSTAQETMITGFSGDQRLTGRLRYAHKAECTKGLEFSNPSNVFCVGDGHIMKADGSCGANALQPDK